MKIVLTGASGFIGGTILARLLRGGDRSQVICLSSSDPGQEKLLARWPQIKVFPLREISSPQVLGAIEGAHAFIHCGWSTVPRTADADPEKDLLENVYNGLPLIENAIRARIDRFVFLSSGGTVYGTSGDVPFNEDQPTKPVSAYGISKLTFEHYLRSYSGKSEMRAIILRPGNIYGRVNDPLRPQGVIEHWMQHIIRDQPLHIWGSTGTIRDYVHVDDLVRVVFAALEYQGQHDTFNVGSGAGTSLQQLLDLLTELSGRELQLIQNASSDAKASANILKADRMRHELGVSPKIDLREGLSQLWNRLLIEEKHRS